MTQSEVVSPALARLFQLSKSFARDLRFLVGAVNGVYHWRRINSLLNPDIGWRGKETLTELPSSNSLWTITLLTIAKVQEVV
jgi:hypothetical protein